MCPHFNENLAVPSLSLQRPVDSPSAGHVSHPPFPGSWHLSDRSSSALSTIPRLRRCPTATLFHPSHTPHLLAESPARRLLDGSRRPPNSGPSPSARFPPGGATTMLPAPYQPGSAAAEPSKRRMGHTSQAWPRRSGTHAPLPHIVADPPTLARSLYHRRWFSRPPPSSDKTPVHRDTRPRPGGCATGHS